MVALDSKFIKDIKCFEGNECLTIFEIPTQLTEDEQKLLDDLATVFYQDQLPQQFEAKAEEQRQLEGQRDLVQEQISNPNNTQTDPQVIEQTVTQQSQDTFSGVSGVSLGLGNPEVTGLNLIEKQTSANVFKRGDIVKVVGKMSLIKPAPYFYNVNITCCEMDSYRVMSAVQTDPSGNFVIKFATNLKFPLGGWTVEISTIGDSNKILKHVYEFRLIE